MIDHLIIGQGVAGSFLAWELRKRGKSVLIVDDDHRSSSSVVSSGIVHPVSGKRLIHSDDYDLFFARARAAYLELENIFGETFFESKPTLRIFQDEAERTTWLSKDPLDPARRYCLQEHAPGHFAPHLDDTFGSIMLSHSGFCRSPRLMSAFKKFFQEQEILVNRSFAYSDLEIRNDGVGFDGNNFGTVIFCEGFKSQFNPWFDWLPFNGAKGEVLTVEIDQANWPDAIVNKGKWAAPIGGNTWLAGANYSRESFDCVPTENGRNEILNGLKFLRSEVKVIDHKAAVRPATSDQKVVIGRHPEIAPLAIFNGLGSKGFLTAPWYASHFADHLTAATELAADITVERFDFNTTATLGVAVVKRSNLKPHFPLLCLTFSILILTGCAHNLSRRAPYADYLGKPLTLKEDAQLAMGEGWTGGNIDMMFFPHHPVYFLLKNSDPLLKQFTDQKGETIPLSKGTELRLFKVINRLYDSSAAVEAQGEIYVPAKGKFVPFVYTWGQQCEKFLHRAPWEDTDIKEETRPLQYGGCPQ